jgi:hypothetical protein
MLAKAKLVEVRWTGDPPQAETVPGGKEVPVQFNPQSLRLNFANEDNSGSRSTPGQSTGSGTSKLTVELLFDTTVDGSDVRRNTENVAFFIKATPGQNNQPPAQPGLSFEWGSFIFRGIVKSMDETLDYFSDEGVPLRATLSLSIARPNIEFIPAPNRGSQGAAAGGQGTGATAPLEAARTNDNVQSVAARNGNSGDWKGIAAANNIDDPLRLSPGTLIDVNAKIKTNIAASARVGASASAGVSAGAGFSGSAGLSAAGSSAAGSANLSLRPR